MKTSELIILLQQELAENGDTDILINDMEPFNPEQISVMEVGSSKCLYLGMW